MECVYLSPDSTVSPAAPNTPCNTPPRSRAQVSRIQVRSRSKPSSWYLLLFRLTISLISEAIIRAPEPRPGLQPAGSRRRGCFLGQNQGASGPPPAGLRSLIRGTTFRGESSTRCWAADGSHGSPAEAPGCGGRSARDQRLNCGEKNQRERGENRSGNIRSAPSK